MRRSVMTMAVVAGLASFSMADEKWYDSLTLGGYVQGSYVNNLNNPSVATNNGRVFDTHANSFNLNAVQLKLAKPVGDDNYGFTVKLLTGQDAKVVNFTEGNGASVSAASTYNVEEAFVTYVVPQMKALSLTAGKFVTSEGLEVIESPLNPNISHGLLFGYAEPFTHTGAKATYSTSILSVMAGIVNGWDKVSDDNKNKSVIWQVTVPTGKITNSLQGTYGKENGSTATTPNDANRLSLDYLLSLALGKASVYFQANYGEEKGDGLTTTKWSGLGAWVNYAFTEKCSAAVRFEVFKDQDNADRLGLGTSYLPHTTKNITVTKKFQLTKAVAFRAEYRHDWSTEGIYNTKHGGTGSSQNTFGADWVVQF